jgi:CBS domain-containing protein
MRSVGQVCNRELTLCVPEATVFEVAILMRRDHVGSVIVVDDPRPGFRRAIGIVTDRDLVVEVVATGLDASTITVGDIMRRNLVTVEESCSIHETVEIMRDKGVRRLPVLAPGGELVGIVTADDVLDIVAGALQDLAKTIVREQCRESVERR